MKLSKPNTSAQRDPERPLGRWWQAVLWVGAIGLLWGGSGCQSWPAAKPPLRIGVSLAPPFAFRHAGRWTGLEVELGRALAERLHMRPVFVALPPAQMTDALLNGKVDLLMGGLTITPERRLQMDFTQPYLTVGQAALVRRADLPRWNTRIKIERAGGPVGVRPHSTGERLVHEYLSEAIPIGFADVNEAVDALVEGKINLFLAEAPHLWWLARQQEGRVAVAPVLLAREDVAWGMRRGSVVLRDSANRALSEWLADGTLETILRRWIPVSK